MTEVDKLKNLANQSVSQKVFVESVVKDFFTYLDQSNRYEVADAFEVAASVYFSLVSTIMLRTTPQNLSKKDYNTAILMLLSAMLTGFQSISAQYDDFMESVRARS